MRTTSALTLMLAGLLLPAPGIGRADAAADFHVAPDGDDRHPGTLEQPFATLVRARDAVRALKQSGEARDILVWLRGGTYRVTETTVFSREDSAPDGHTVTYAAHPGERPVLSAAVPIRGWTKVEEPPDELPAAARGKLWSAPMPEGLRPFFTLYHSAGRLPRARGPGFTPTDKAASWHREDQQTVRFPPGALRAWENLPQIELVLITAAPWTMNILPLESVDESAGLARTVLPATYAPTRPIFGHFPESAWIENTLAVLDAPGEWVLDAAQRRIYLWPDGDAPGDDIVAPALTEIIRIEGDIDYDGPADQPVKGLVFRGITFTQADRFTWEKDRQGLGLQHDWEMFDRPTAMLRMRGTEQCVVEECRFMHSGATAIRLDLHAQHNRINRNTIEHVGGVGILLAGYGPGAKDVNRNNEVTRNHIHHVGQIYWHSPAIFVWQSGENLIGNNLLHHTPYSGIVVSGRIILDRSGKGECSRTVRWKEVDQVLPSLPANWEAREPLLHARRNRIYRNEIHHAVEVMTDGNAIYISGAGRKNIVRENYIHTCPSRHFAEGIRCDDDQFETVIDRNILWRLGGLATYICIKGRNHVTHNILAEPLNPPTRGMLSLEPPKGDPIDGSVIQRNLFYTTRKDDRIVFQGTNYYGRHALLSECDADRNLYFNTADPDWGRAHIADGHSRGSEMNSLVADPLFEDPENGDFRIKPGSPALTIGFEPMDSSTAGLGP
jgi:hypothetical protein